MSQSKDWVVSDNYIITNQGKTDVFICHEDGSRTRLSSAYDGDISRWPKSMQPKWEIDGGKIKAIYAGGSVAGALGVVVSILSPPHSDGQALALLLLMIGFLMLMAATTWDPRK